MSVNIKITITIIVILLIGIIFLLWLKWDTIIGKKTIPISPINPQAIQNIPLIPIPSQYNQNDEKWSNDLLGNTKESLGNIGCLVSSIAMNLSYYNIIIDPKKLNQKLQKIDGYTKDGWLIWDKLKDATENRININFPKLSHKSIDELLLAKTPVLAKIFIDKRIPHWVLIVGKKEGKYLIYDPLKSDTLKNISVYNSLIYSIRIVIDNVKENRAE